ncbi:hypothetical protein [Bacillus cereus]|uniref:response regulator aspartate phosphatase n=1 Tax=Bacillus cereus TaxID=1396 RepID=UPI003A88D2E2
MSTNILMHEAVMQQLNDFYQMMLSQQIIKATELKKEIDEKIEQIKHAEEKENQNLLLYYSLLDLKYRMLTDRVSIRKDSFEAIELLEEEVKKGISYFEKQDLWDFVEEYAEVLAVRFRKLNKHEKVSDYFDVCYEAKQKLLSKGALK